MAIFSILPIFLTFENLAILLSGNFQLNNQSQIKAIDSNKNYNDSEHFKQQLRFKRHDNSLYNAKIQNPDESFLTNRLINGANVGVKPSTCVLEEIDKHQDEPIPLENSPMNSHKKMKEGRVVYNRKRDAPSQPRSKFKPSFRGEKLKNKRENGAETKSQNYAIDKKHNGKRPMLLSNRQKVTDEIEPEESIESTLKALNHSLRLDYLNETLYWTTSLNVRDQLPILTPNNLISDYPLGPISKQYYKKVTDIGQDSQLNGQLEYATKYSTLNYISSNLVKKQILRDNDNVISVGDTFQNHVLRSIKYKLNTQTIIQTDYLPSFNDLDNSNNNISLRSMPYAPSETLNKTVTKPKKKNKSKKKSRSKKNEVTRYFTKAERSKVVFTKSKRPTKHRTIHQRKVSIKYLKITRKRMKVLSTMYKNTIRKASKKRTLHSRKNKTKKKEDRLIISEHHMNVEDVIKYVNDYRMNSNHQGTTKSYTSISKKMKSYPGSLSQKAKHSKKHSNADGKNLKRVNRNTVHEKEKSITNLYHHPRGYLARMVANESDLVKPLKMLNRDNEYRRRYRNDELGGTFNSYKNFKNNNYNQFIYISSAMTDRNVVNNLIVIEFDTSPPTKSTEAPKLTSGETPPPKSTICNVAQGPTVYFIKKKAVKDYSILIAAIFLIALAIIICCCCGLAPIIIYRRRNKNKNKTSCTLKDDSSA